MRVRTVLLGILAVLTQKLFAVSQYDTAVLQDHPVVYLRLSALGTSHTETDQSGNGRSGRYFPTTASFAKTQLPNGEAATVFDGVNQYVEVDSSAALSVRRGGALTLEAWIRPDTLEFSHDEGDGYVHWAGKGEAGEHEYVCRMYSKTNSAHRPNRISAYAFNPAGGLGSGSYFQDTVQVGKWIHVAFVINTRTRPGTIQIYKNGILRQSTPLSQFHVVPRAGKAPLRIGTRDFRSFFKGAVGKFAIYAYGLSPQQLQNHATKMK